MVLVRFTPSEVEELVGLKTSDFIDIPWKLGGESRIENGEFIVEFNPDRPDLYSLWGLSRAVRIYKGLESYKNVKIRESEFLVENEGPDYRPYIVSAIVTNSIAGKNIEKLIDYQEKLHATIGRNRRIAAIGIHDLDKVKFPLRYTSVDRDYKFIPLGEEATISLFDFLQTHEKAKEFGGLIKERIPAILDNEGNIISLPPILNSDITALTKDTKNFFIDVTGTDPLTIQRALNLLVTALSYPEGEIVKVKVGMEKYPKFQKSKWKINQKKVKEISGMEFNLDEIKGALVKMGYEVNDDLAISPEYRIDILNDVDFIEDVLKGIGYDNIEESMEDFHTVGSPHNLREIERIIRHLLVGYGFTETVNFAMVNGSYNSIFGFSQEYIKILNPVTMEQDVLRPRISISLIQSLLNNHRNPYPQRIFEIGTVVRNDKQLSSVGIATCHKSAGFSEIKGVFIGLMEDLKLEYDWEKFSHQLLVEGRGASIKVGGRIVGFIGEVNPKILKQIGLRMPVAVGELDITGAIL